jgi:hypothetical protein
VSRLPTALHLANQSKASTLRIAGFGKNELARAGVDRGICGGAAEGDELDAAAWSAGRDDSRPFAGRCGGHLGATISEIANSPSLRPSLSWVTNQRG